jgi:O-antigen biosynthesis protein
VPRFTAPTAPLVAVVVVTHGARDWVTRCLSALRDQTDPVYELVVVDNASPDGTLSWLRTHVAGAKVLALPTNIGFGPACDLGVAASRAPLVCLLNSDAMVEPGWLDPVLERFDAGPDVGAVASRLLELDGSVQEAGSVLFDGLETQAWGRGLEVQDPATRVARDVEYASAACMTFRRAALIAVGGFDARYAPAYYEDVDLCLALAEAGWRVTFEPRSLVRHARGRSSRSDAVVALMQRNRTRALARWARTASPRPALHGAHRLPHRLLHARDAAGSARVLVVAHTEGGAGAGLARDLARTRPDVRVSLLVLAPQGAQALDELLDAGVEAAWDPPDRETWFAERRFLYDLAVVEDVVARRLVRDDLAQHQPQARITTLDPTLDLPMLDGDDLPPRPARSPVPPGSVSVGPGRPSPGGRPGRW